MNAKGIFTIPLLAWAMAPLQAQMVTPRGLDVLSGSSPQIEMGIQGFLVFPQGDLRSTVNGKTGFQVGAHGSLGMAESSEWRPRIDYTRLDSGSSTLSSGSSATTIQAVSLGLDYLAYLGTSRRGLYGFAGANLAWWYGQDRDSGTTRETYPGLRVGAGNRFGQAFSLEANLDLSRFRPSAGTESRLTLGAFYKF